MSVPQHDRHSTVSRAPRASRSRTWWRPASTALAVAAAAAALLPVRALAVDTDLQGKADVPTVRAANDPKAPKISAVIIRVQGDLTAGREAQLTRLGVSIYRRLGIINSVAARVPTSNLTRVAALPFVQHLSADMRVAKSDAFTVGSTYADVAWQHGVNGGGVTVAVLDSGVRAARDLGDPEARLLRGPSFVPGSYDDQCGHGTHVAGIIAGNGRSSTGPFYTQTFYGIAPRARVLSVKVLDAHGQGDVSTAIAAVQWVVANRSRYNVRVLNLSLGHPVGESYKTDPLCRVVEAAWRSGIVVVCAAGNEGRQQNDVDPALNNEGYGTAYGSIQSPGNDPLVITVGATKSIDGNRANDRVATYSGRGPSRLDFVMKPDIVAPGNKVISLQATGSYLATAFDGSNLVPMSEYARMSMPGANSNRYFRLSGTSMAAPVVAGAAALLIDAQPRLTPDTVKARLMISADKVIAGKDIDDPLTYGAGYLNIPAALACTATATAPAASPSLTRDSRGNVTVSIDLALWGQQALWGFHVSGLQAIWGTQAIWGFNTLSGSQAIWGTSVWSDLAIWGTDSAAADLSMKAIDGEN